MIDLGTYHVMLLEKNSDQNRTQRLKMEDIDCISLHIRGLSQMTSAYFWTFLTPSPLPCQQFYTIEFRNFNETPSPVGC